MTEFFLCAAANRNDHLCRATPLNQRNKIWIFDFESIARRDITILASESVTLPAATNPTVFAWRVRWERSKKLLQSPPPFNLASRCFKYFRPEMR